MINRLLCAAAMMSVACSPVALAGASSTSTDGQPTVYVAKLHPVNAKVTGLETTGERVLRSITLSMSGTGGASSRVLARWRRGFQKTAPGGAVPTSRATARQERALRAR